MFTHQWIDANPDVAEAFCNETPGDGPRTRAVEMGNFQVR